MNAKHILATLAVFAATSSAFAADNGIFVEHINVPSTKTRAEVSAELEQANALNLMAGNSEFVEYAHVSSNKSRDEVRGEAAQARNQSGRPLCVGG